MAAENPTSGRCSNTTGGSFNEAAAHGRGKRGVYVGLLLERAPLQ